MKLVALGADEVAVGTALMIAEQCIFCHGCAKGDCPAGITTQDAEVAGRLMLPKDRAGRERYIAERGGALDDEARYDDAKRGVRNYLLALGRTIGNGTGCC